METETRVPREVRFSRSIRLFGPDAWNAINNASACVVGLGGVGSWCAEALARSGVGKLTLIDGDIVDVSNSNRQLPALASTIGRPKAEVVAERLRLINPDADIRGIHSFITKENAGELIPEGAVIAEAIDSVEAKAALSAWAVTNGRTIITSGGAGGRTDPSLIRVADVSRVTDDSLISRYRALLRKSYGFPAGSPGRQQPAPFGITCVYAAEPAKFDGEGFGSFVVVTGSMGLRIASTVIGIIIAGVR